jgi:hypothetical protein
MPKILKQLSGEGVAGNEDFPPMFYVKFDEKEFADFVADPVKTMKAMGRDVEHLTVSISNSGWVSGKKKWIKSSEAVLEDLPGSQSWGWLCGVTDEMSVCHRVLM